MPFIELDTIDGLTLVNVNNITHVGKRAKSGVDYTGYFEEHYVYIFVISRSAPLICKMASEKDADRLFKRFKEIVK